jgi:cobalt-zinc-cadmium efflux system membrane fusion protein
VSSLNSAGILLWGVLLITLPHAFVGCSAQTSQPERPAAAPVEPDLVTLNPDALPQGSLQFDEARLAVIPEELQVTGRIGVNENLTSRVGTLAGGRVTKVLAGVGDRVEKGSVLALINSHEVHDTRSEYAKAIAELQRCRAELEYAKNAKERAGRLYKLKALSLEQLQRAETDQSSAELSVSSAQAEVNRVEETLRHLGVPVESALEEYTKPGEARGQYEEEEMVPVLSPIMGTVMQRLVSPGVVVTTADNLFVISDLSTLWVIAEVPEKNLSALRAGRPVGIAVQAYENRIFPGRIALIGSSLDPNTRTVQVRCETSDQKGQLKPEMYATIRIQVGEGRQGTVIPPNAVQDMDGQNIVFIREAADRFRARQVRLGRQTGSQVEVLEGIKTGETIVTKGSFLLKSELLKRRFSVE